MSEPNGQGGLVGLITGLFGGGGPTSGGNAPRQPTYSLARLQQLYDRLSQFRESDLERPGGGEAVVECVRQITEALVWGEQNDANFFDFFCEKSILADFIRVLSLHKAPKTVKVQLLQTLSMLVQNIRRQTSLYYLLSNNYVNRLIATPLDFSDEEILAYYITFLKSLAMRVDVETVKFFFIQHPHPHFPLYIEATKFFSHRDQMVRATVRTITLQVYPIAFPPMRQFVLRHAAESYFSQLAYHLRDLWLRLDAATIAADQDFGAVQHENDLQQDLLVYLSDVFELGVAELNEVLADRLLNCAMLPVFLSSVAAPSRAERSPGASPAVPASATAPREASAYPNRVLTPTVALFLMRQVFDIIHCRVLLEPLAATLLQPTVPATLACALPQGLEPRPLPPSAASGENFVPNPLREHFLKFLRSHDDGPFILSAAIVHSCAKKRQAFSARFLESAKILPPAEGGRGSPGKPRQDAPGDSFEVFVLLLQATQRHAHWQPDTFRALLRIIMDVFLDPAASQNADCQRGLVQAVRFALQSAAQQLHGLLQQRRGAERAGEDPFLDEFFEEWELHRAPLVSVAEVCGDARRLLQPDARRGPAAPGERQALCCLLLLRRCLTDLLKFISQAPHKTTSPSAGRPQPQGLLSTWAAEPSPLQMDAASLGGFREGLSIEIGNVERIVCGVTTMAGRQTRYLVLHDFWLLLMQPDLAAPGRALVTTLWPMQQVQALTDRSDPRTLRLGLQAYDPEAKPGESVAFGQPLTPAHVARGRSSALYTMALNFEDVKRCHAANVHLQRRRQEVRAHLMQKAMSFASACCTPGN